MSAWAAIAWLWLHLTAISLLSGVGMVGLMWMLGAPPTVAKLHMGPGLFSFRLFGVRWSFGPLTFGTSLAFTPEDEPEGLRPNPYLSLSFPRRLVAVSSSVLLMLLIAVVCLSPLRALESWLSGFGQMVNVFRASERVEAFLALRPLGFRATLGVLAAKLAALNMLPIPPLSGYLLLREVVGRLRKQAPSEMGSMPIWGFVLTLALWVGWGWGVFHGMRVHGAKYAAAIEAAHRE